MLDLIECLVVHSSFEIILCVLKINCVETEKKKTLNERETYSFKFVLREKKFQKYKEKDKKKQQKLKLSHSLSRSITKVIITNHEQSIHFIL
jgi:hypothetical protein